MTEYAHSLLGVALRCRDARNAAMQRADVLSRDDPEFDRGLEVGRHQAFEAVLGWITGQRTPEGQDAVLQATADRERVGPMPGGEVKEGGGG